MIGEVCFFKNGFGSEFQQSLIPKQIQAKSIPKIHKESDLGRGPWLRVGGYLKTRNYQTLALDVVRNEVS